MEKLRFHLARLPWRRLLLAGALFWLAIAIFAELAEDIIKHKKFIWDVAILEWIHQFFSPPLTAFVLTTTSTGGFWGALILTAAIASLLWYFHHPYRAVILVILMSTLALMNVVLKLIFTRARPELWPRLVDIHGYSFPSGHAMLSSGLAFTVIALMWTTKFRWLAIGIGVAYMAIIGFTRLYLAVHYPSDVLAGWCVSGAWVILFFTILKLAKLLPQSESTVL